VAPKTVKIDISENRLRNRGRILDILLTSYHLRRDCSRIDKQNIIWATDSYVKSTKRNDPFSPTSQIKRDQITGSNGKRIQPRAAKSLEEQKFRTKDKAEVFTPLSVVKEMNMAINWSSKNWPATKDNWINYLKELKLEITCGEAPFIAGRYDPANAKDVVNDTKKRVGFLDYKLKTVNTFVSTKKEWLEYAEVALKACYGYEWQGDNLLIARENILLTMDDFYRDFCVNKLKLKSQKGLSDEQLEYFAEIISWNIFQMDGLKYVMPMSCITTLQDAPPDIPKNQISMFITIKPQKLVIECPGCQNNEPYAHTGKYSVIKDWQTNKKIRFVDLLER
jgi:hypothetical protein